jgi:hypothetical protein
MSYGISITYEPNLPLFQTISDSVNDLLELEEQWKKNGYTITEVPSFFAL